MSKNLDGKPTKAVMPKLVEEVLRAKKLNPKARVDAKQSSVEAYGAAIDFMLNGSKEDFSVEPKQMGQKVIELVRAYNSIPNEYWLFTNVGTAVERKAGLINQDHLDKHPDTARRVNVDYLQEYWKIEEAYMSVCDMLIDFNSENRGEIVFLFEERIKPYWAEQEAWSKARKEAFEKFVAEHKSEIDTEVEKRGAGIDGYERRRIIKEVAGPFKFNQKRPIDPKLENPYIRASSMALTEDELKEISKDFE